MINEPSISELTDQQDAWLMKLLKDAYYAIVDCDDVDDPWVQALITDIEETGVLEMVFVEVDELEDGD